MQEGCQLCSQVMQLQSLWASLKLTHPSLRILLRTHKVTHRSTILEPLEFGKLLVRIDEYVKEAVISPSNAPCKSCHIFLCAQMS